MTRAFFPHSRLKNSKKPQKHRSTIYFKLYSSWIFTEFLTNALIIMIDDNDDDDDYVDDGDNDDDNVRYCY